MANGTAELNGSLWSSHARAWADIQEGTARPLYLDVLERLGVDGGTAHLDVGCGAGMALQASAARGAKVAGIDAAPALLAIARERVPQAELHVGEIETLPFDDHRFDVITGFNAFQYAAQPVRALEQARRVAKKGARVIIAVWASPDRTKAAEVIACLKPLMPPPPPGAPGPFALSDEAALRKLASDAGLTPGEVHDVESPFAYPDVETAIRGLNSSGVAEKAMRHSGVDAVTAAHRSVVEKYRRPDGSVHIQNAFRYLVATT